MLPVYPLSHLKAKHIDWKCIPPDIEPLKGAMLRNLQLAIFIALEQPTPLAELSIARHRIGLGANVTNAGLLRNASQ